MPRRRPPAHRLRAPAVRARAGRPAGLRGVDLPGCRSRPCWARSSTGDCSSGCEQVARRHLRRQVRRPRAAREAHPELHDRLQADRDVRHATTRRSPQPNAEVVTDGIARGPRARRSSPPTASSARSTRSSWAPASTCTTTPGSRADPRPRRPDAGARRGRAPRGPIWARRSPASPTSSCSWARTAPAASTRSSSPAKRTSTTPCARSGRWIAMGSTPSRSGRRCYDAFAREAEQKLRDSVWNAGGCASWYLDPNGRNAVWWPGFMCAAVAAHAPLRAGRIPPPARLAGRLGRGRTGARRVHGALDFRAAWGGVAWQRSRQRLRV